MNKHLRMNQIIQNQEGIGLPQAEYVIRGTDGLVSKDKTFGKRTIFPGSLHFFILLHYVYSHP